MDISITESGKDNNITIIKLAGRLDAHPAEEIENTLLKLIDQGNKKILLNLENIEYLGSSGIRVFLSVKKKLQEQNGELKICNMSSASVKILKAMEIFNMFDIYTTDKEAIDKFQ